MNTNELASAYVSEFGPCASVDAEWAGTAFSEAYDNEEGKYFDEFLLELDAKMIRESAPEATEEKIARWKDRLPEDLRFGTFDPDFQVEGCYYRYGAWNDEGSWWLAWNTEEEFVKQINSCESL